MKTLIDKIRKGWRNTKLIAVAAAAIGLASCTEQCTPIPPIPPNYPPEITSTPTTQINEGSTYNYDVDAIDIDKDKLTYSLPLAPPWLSIDSSTGLISGVAPQIDADTPYDIEVGVSDGINPIVTQNYTLTVKNVIPPIEDYLDVEGYLQDNETDTGKGGLVKILDSANLTTPIETVSANPTTGYFSFHSTTKKVSDLSGVVLKAISTDVSDIQNSYVRTKTFPAGDVTVNPIRVVPYPAFCTNEEFKTFMNQINISIFPIGAYQPETGLIKWNLSQLQGIEILLQNPVSGVSFTEEKQNIIADRIKSSDDIELYVKGRELDSLVQIDNSYPPSNPHYTIGPLGPGPDEGWIIVVPSDMGGGQTYFAYLNDSKLTGIINRVRIDLTPSIVNLNNPVTTHEFGHAFIASNPDYDGHSSILLNPLTIMTVNNLKLPPPGVADEKAAYIVYENTYQPREKLDDILGTTF